MLQLLENGDKKAHEVYHFWKSATANLLISLGPRVARDERVLEVVGNLLSLLRDLPTNLSHEKLAGDLTAIVEQAAVLDETMCRQQSWFFLRYPSQRFDISVDDMEMDRQEGVAPGEFVKFVIRPALCQAGKGVEDSVGLRVLSRHLVFV